MEILLDLDVCKGLPCDDTLEISDNDKEEIRKRLNLTNICDTKFVNIGPGADLIVLLLIINIGLTVLKLGSEINDGIEGWISLGKKLNHLFRKRKIVSVDIDGATSLAVGLIAQHEKIVTLEKIQETTINLVDVSGIIPTNTNLSAKPHNYYIQAYRINYEEIYVVGITSTGEAQIIKHFGFNPYGIKEIKQ